MKTTTVTENENSGEITDFQNKEIFKNGSHVFMVIFDVRRYRFSLLNVRYGTVVNDRLTYEQMISMLNDLGYKRFRGEVVFKQD